MKAKCAYDKLGTKSWTSLLTNSILGIKLFSKRNKSTCFQYWKYSDL